MSTTYLPTQIEPQHLAEGQVSLHGYVKTEGMQRFNALIIGSIGDILVDIAFDKDAVGMITINGSFATHVQLQCQRCMLPLDWSINAQFTLSPISDEQQAKDLPSSYDPLLTDAGIADLNLLIEDELLLALPQVASHETEQCHAKNVEAGPSRDKPFAKLASLDLKESK